MKKLLFALAFLAALCSPALASVTISEDGAREGEATTLNISTGLNAVRDHGTVTLSADNTSIINSAIFEGATADANETTLTVVDPTADNTVTIPDATGSTILRGTTSVITAGATPTITVVPGTNRLYTDTITTDNQDQTLTFSGPGLAGDVIRIMFITDTGGSGDEVITFQTTLANSSGTLTLANLTAGRYVVSFMSDGTVWNEISRTAALS